MDIGLRIMNLTNISDGSLLACCRQSTAFKYVKNTYIELDKIRNCWRDFLKNSDVVPSCETWVDAWKAFNQYADSEAIEYAESTLCEEFEGELISEFPKTTISPSYKLFFTTIGRIRLYSSGVMSRGTDNIGFASTFALNKSNLCLSTSGFRA